MAIQIISSIEYAPVHSIIGFETYPDGTSRVMVEEWKPIPMHPASGEMETNSKEDASGIYFSTTINARLKEGIVSIPASILKVKLCSGKEFILGSPSIPTRSHENSSLTRDLFEIEYVHVSKPWELIP
ncbi:hypothetical protein [Sphingobacterium daejeonense]|uniref:hypothetical protein n=1 Tax=Sphingobacterium daejeonense TaxID=371142 RepID=UPI0010C5B010|nr:hypothetical protein [Sphingobacterium daejeonense]VTQ01769.1 Uncharacterised protein [Sphingobacterium daejeonense]